MTASEKRKLVRLIKKMVALESEPTVQWNAVRGISNDMIKFMGDHRLDGSLDPYVMKFLDDVDVREIDKDYGDFQRRKILEVMNAM